MKRRKQRQQQADSTVDGEIYAESAEPSRSEASYGLKSFNSSPDLQQIKNQSEDDYSKPFKMVLRPKTPPPPPPPLEKTLITSKPISEFKVISYETTASTSCANVNSTLQLKSLSSDAKIPPPAPPPPPPANFLTKIKLKPDTLASSKLQTPESSKSATELQKCIKSSDCRGISAEALLNIKLKPVQKTVQKNDTSKSELNNVKASFLETTKKLNVDFDADLKNALARRRSKTNLEEDINTAFKSNTTTMNSVVVIKEPTTNIVG